MNVDLLQRIIVHKKIHEAHKEIPGIVSKLFLAHEKRPYKTVYERPVLLRKKTYPAEIILKDGGILIGT